MIKQNDLEESRVWRNIDLFLSDNPRRVARFKEELKDAKINETLEKQNPLKFAEEDPELECFLEESWPEPGTELALSLSQEFKERAMAVQLFVFEDSMIENEDTIEKELNYYRVAGKLNPNDVEAIKGAARGFKLKGEYDRSCKKMVHLAYLAKENQDLELARFILQEDIVKNVLRELSIEKSNNNDASASKIITFRPLKR